MILVVPGQGAQRSGMGGDVAEEMPASRAAFDRPSSALGLDVLQLLATDEAAGINGTRPAVDGGERCGG